jgi:predicted RND superfamily exporter protein
MAIYNEESLLKALKAVVGFSFLFFSFKNIQQYRGFVCWLAFLLQ